jgi:penicillin-binding protein 1A
MSRSVKIFWKAFFIAVAAFILFLLLCNWGVFGKMPSISDIQNPSASLSSQVYAQDGTLMGKYYLEDRVNVDFKDISPNIVHALVATEDQRFYDHSGIDFISLLRAIKGFGRDGGASTITMQTAKNLFTENWSTRNFLLRAIQKVKESIIAVKLERNFTKNEIINLYLNTVAYGDKVFGIRKAAKTFFQKEPERVNVNEAAVLVGMINAPTLYNPRRNPKQALERRNLVLNRMVTNGYLTPQEGAKIKLEPIELNYKKLDETTGLAPYFRLVLGEYMKQWCKTHKKNNGEEYNLYTDGLRIYTTINPRMQIYAEEAVAKHLSYMQQILNQQANIKKGTVWDGHQNVLEAAMKQSDRWRNLKKEGLNDDDIKNTFFVPTSMRIFAWNKNREKDTIMTPMDSIKYCRQMMQAGFMALDPLSGEVRAWVGGIDFKTFKYDHVNYNTKRQVGSTIKPLLYSLAVEDAGFTPNTIVQDVQQSFGAYGMVPATSTSCTGASIPMAQALAVSRNCATAYIMKQLDPKGNNAAIRLVDFLKNKCGLQTNIEPHPSIAIGACEISLYEMMQAYSMFSRRGFNVKPLYITRIEDRNGNVLEKFAPLRKEVMSDITAYSVIKMMEGVVDFGTARGLKMQFDVRGNIAGKTGTTDDNSDAWFMGYTPQLLADVWVGCDDRFIHISSNSYNGQGARAAMPIWGYFYEKVLQNANTLGIDANIDFSKPEGMTNDIEIDYSNPNPNVPMGVEGDQQLMGNGTSQDYVPADIKPEDLAPESQIDTNKLPAFSPKKNNNTPKNGTTPTPTPKAILPKKVGGNFHQ